ncbi:glycine dehydrogenase (decarboxylating) alpha subunit [Armatimonadetes bacterium GBS]|jgi:glycine dehydrogenase subunit 1|nr:MAG: glycine dehydrogenase [Fimbriimonadales bacterium]CUU04971.1 glycine dehydrogenase (decarboxylating) alpha subunit [Armatimonadetes bacterium GBS]CUU36307.1 glycine dehydrogenase (decarboxylating) alpha subunit [Armatimonadetes bacterium GXS]
MRYIPHTEEDIQQMLATIGVASIRDLFQDIPDSLYLKEPLPIPDGLDEHALFKRLARLASQNADTTRYLSFLGAGAYDHFIPSIVQTLISRGEFLTAYTPYQPEASQGLLQSIFEFQTMVCELTGMEVANASMYDASTALAESALMACQITGRSRVIASQAIHPHYRQVLRTYLWTNSRELVEIPHAEGITDSDALRAAIDDQTACVLVQYPNFFGLIEPLAPMVETAHQHGALAIVCADPMALGVLKPPGEYGVDIVVGEGQSLGNAMGFGGPFLGLFACKQEYVRRIPGRIVGQTTDSEGRRGFVMTLRTREQDIRREKATSNICTNEALCALASTIFMSALGKQGFRELAETCTQKAHYAAQRLTEIPGVALRFPKTPFFKEFVLELPLSARAVCDRLLDKQILAGLPLEPYYPNMENALLVCVTETRTREEIETFAESLADALRK